MIVFSVKILAFQFGISPFLPNKPDLLHPIYLPNTDTNLHAQNNHQTDKSDVISFMAQVEVNGIRYEIDEAHKTAKVLDLVNQQDPVTLPDLTRRIKVGSREYTVTVLGKDCFKHHFSRGDIHVPDSIEVIEEGVFAHDSIYRVELSPDSKLREIGPLVFAGSNITSISLPKTVVKIANGAFQKCQRLTEVHIPADSDIEVISESLFSGSGIKTIVIQSSVREIEPCAFSRCPSLSKVIFNPDSRLVKIGESAFSQATNSVLSSINFPESLMIIGPHAFEWCRQLKTVTFGSPCSLVEIGSHAFFACALQKIVIPRSVEKLGEWSLSMPSLSSVTFESQSKLTDIGEHAFQLCAIASISVPPSVTAIGNSAFRFCRELKKVILPLSTSSLKEIGEGAFLETGLKEISIPRSVEKIHEGAFFYCDALETVHLKNCSASLVCDSYTFVETFIDYSLDYLRQQRQPLWEV